ncbi:MAG: STAS domain-containing protein [Bacteroidetes bacterium]|jgi:anti-anti-sigma factor|nr:STAS domain-containing protein [Bacteroidota bacterium]
MKYSIDERYNAVVLKLKGNVMGGPDGAKLHDQLRDLRDDGKKNVVVDLSRVKFMNSSGLGMLISGMTSMRNEGGPPVLDEEPPSACTILSETSACGAVQRTMILRYRLYRP